VGEEKQNWMALSAKHLRAASSPWEDLVDDGEGGERVQQRGAGGGGGGRSSSFVTKPPTMLVVQLRTLVVQLRT